MGKSGRLACFALLALVLAPARLDATRLYVKKDAAGYATGYYLVGQFDIEHLMRREHIQMVRNTIRRKIEGEYDVHAITDSPNLPEGQYYIFAVCSGNFTHSNTLIDEGQGRMELACPRPR